MSMQHGKRSLTARPHRVQARSISVRRNPHAPERHQLPRLIPDLNQPIDRHALRDARLALPQPVVLRGESHRCRHLERLRVCTGISLPVMHVMFWDTHAV